MTAHSEPRPVPRTPGFPAEHGLLPVLLVALTVVTGLVDAVSILSLGRVFVGNMTGNIVFVAFALAGAPGFSLSASLSALGGFLVGGVAAGLLITRVSSRGLLLVVGTAIETVLFAAATALLFAVDPQSSKPAASITAALLALALGLQNGIVRRLAVPDLTTTVLTMTLTGVAADFKSGAVTARRIVAVGSMFGGGAAGAVLTLHAGPQWALLTALCLLAATAAAAAPLHRLRLLANT